jgi:hypothetical protein
LTSQNEPGSEHLFHLITGYFASQAIYVAAQLGLADLLVEGPLRADDLAQATATHPRSLYRLLRALASLGVFAEDDDHRFALTPLAEPLRSDRPDSQRPAALMMGGEFFQTWGGLLESIRTGQPAFATLHGQPYFSYLAEHPDQARTFDAAMTALNDRKTLAMLDVYDFSGLRVLADIGGGNGSTLVRILGRHPTMQGLLFDLPGVIDRARVDVERAGMADRCRLVGGSFLETVPGRADVYLLRHIVHNWDDEHAIAILRNLRRAIAPGAKLLVVERVIPPGNEPLFGKLMDLTMLVVHGGIERTDEEFRRLFEAAGLRLSRIVPTAVEVSLIEGEPA